MDLITAEWCREKGVYYPKIRLAELFDRAMTLREVMTRTDGLWANVSARDRVWVACRAMPAREARLLACQWAERVLRRERDAGREPHPDSWRAIGVSRRYADGLATDEELAAAASAAAWAATNTAALEPAREAVWAARQAAWAAAQESAWAATWVAAWVFLAWGAAESEEVRAQVADVLAVLDDLEQ